MKRTIGSLVVILLMAFILTGVMAQAEKAQYIGADKCKMCHMSKSRGQQYPIWKESKHSKAYETLASEQSKAIAEKAGVSGDPQKAEECLVCHVTAYGEPKSKFAASFSMEEGVGCETCHGPGSEYKSMKVMKDLAAGKIDPATVAFKAGNKETCLGCHNEKSPTFKGFNFEEDYAKIKHPTPE